MYDVCTNVKRAFNNFLNKLRPVFILLLVPAWHSKEKKTVDNDSFISNEINVRTPLMKAFSHRVYHDENRADSNFAASSSSVSHYDPITVGGGRSFLNQAFDSDTSKVIRFHRRPSNHRVVTSIKISDSVAPSLRRGTSISPNFCRRIFRSSGQIGPLVRARARERQFRKCSLWRIGRRKVERYRQTKRDEVPGAN